MDEMNMRADRGERAMYAVRSTQLSADGPGREVPSTAHSVLRTAYSVLSTVYRAPAPPSELGIFSTANPPRSHVSFVHLPFYIHICIQL